jgi:hypothetical protein
MVMRLCEGVVQELVKYVKKEGQGVEMVVVVDGVV